MDMLKLIQSANSADEVALILEAMGASPFKKPAAPKQDPRQAEGEKLLKLLGSQGSSPEGVANMLTAMATPAAKAPKKEAPKKEAPAQNDLSGLLTALGAAFQNQFFR